MKAGQLQGENLPSVLSRFFCLPERHCRVAEIFSESHRALQIFCADYWPLASDSEAILAQVITGPNRINMAEPALARWLSIIKELLRKNDGSMQRLVIVLTSEYPQNDALRTVCAPWIPATGAIGGPPQTIAKEDLPPGTVLVEEFKPHTDAAPVPIPVIAASGFADEIDMVIPRINTLWDVMVEQEKRLVELERLAWVSPPEPRTRPSAATKSDKARP